MTPVHQLMSCEVKTCMFVQNKSINKMLLNLNHGFCLKYKACINIISFSSETVSLIQKCAQIMMMDLFLANTQLFTLQDVNWWTGVVLITCGLLFCFYQLFGLTHFDGTHSLQRIHWWVISYLFWLRNKLINILDGLRGSNFFFSKLSFLGELFL